MYCNVHAYTPNTCTNLLPTRTCMYGILANRKMKKTTIKASQHHCIHTVPLKKKLKYLGSGSVTVRYWFAFGALMVRSRYALGALLVRYWYALKALQVRSRDAVRFGAVRCGVVLCVHCYVYTHAWHGRAYFHTHVIHFSHRQIRQPASEFFQLIHRRRCETDRFTRVATV